MSAFFVVTRNFLQAPLHCQIASCFQHCKPTLPLLMSCSKYSNTSIGITSMFKSVNDVNFHYQTAGEGDHVILLLPGAFGSGETDFQHQLQKLNREKFHLVAFDPRGYGKSRPPDRDFPPDFFHRDAKDAADLMSALGHKQYSVLGWSDGGMTGIILAAKAKESLRKLVIWGCNSYLTQNDIDLFQATRDIDNWSQRMKEPMIKLYGEENFRKSWPEWVDLFSTLFEENKTDICMQECREIDKPTLILHGDKDPMVPMEHPIYLQRHIVGSRLVRFPDGKHNIHMRYPDEFNRHIETFLLDEPGS